MIFRFTILFFAFSLLLGVQGYASPNIKRLKNKKNSIDKKIKQYANYLKETKEKGQSVLSKIEQLSYNIKLKEGLIVANRQEIKYLEKSIALNKNKINKLKKNLSALKQDYARMIVNSFKTNNSKNKLLFFLSSNDFFQLYKRISYMKQYSASRRLKGLKIEKQTKVLNKAIAKLEKQQKVKKALITHFNDESIKLLKIKQKQKKLYGKLKIDEKKYKSEIVKQEKQIAAIDKKIEKLINLFIEQQKNATIKLTKETALIASSFEGHKGSLPWPVKKGIISKNFGQQRHPVLARVTIFCSGIEITTSKNSVARSIFDGEVVSVQLLHNNKKTVYIRHGNYITVYSNLRTVDVKQGDSIKMKEPIGTIVYDSLQKKTILKFLLYKNNIRLNPTKWISKS